MPWRESVGCHDCEHPDRVAGDDRRRVACCGGPLRVGGRDLIVGLEWKLDLEEEEQCTEGDVQPKQERSLHVPFSVDEEGEMRKYPNSTGEEELMEGGELDVVDGKGMHVRRSLERRWRSMSPCGALKRSRS